MPTPTVSTVTPNIGSNNGGASLTLTGTNFSGTTGVTIGGAAAANVVIVSPTSITLSAPAGSAGIASILVTNASGTNAANSLFFYVGAGIPSDTYIYLQGGRGDGLVPLWTGSFYDALINENSEPYRDIFPAATILQYPAGSGAGFVHVPTVSGIIFTAPVVVPSADSTTAGAVTATLTGTTSDEYEHIAPRQFVKMATWRHYLSSNGKYYAFRLVNIIGVGSLSRDF